MKNKEEFYTIGEIFRAGLLLNHWGKPFGDKSQVAKIVRSLKYRIVKTKWGPAKAIPLTEILKYNAKTSTKISTTNRKQRTHTKIR